MKVKISRFRRYGGLLLVASVLSACANVPQARLYLLEPPTGQESDEARPASTTLRQLGVAMVSLPGYAVNSQIASLTPNGSVTQDNENRWAEEPAVAINRLLVNRLREQTGATVLSEPWPRDYQPTVRVKVMFDRLLREPRGGADMAGQILLLSGDGRKLLSTVPFEFVLYGRETTRRVFFVAVAQGIDDIARMAVESVQELKLR